MLKADIDLSDLAFRAHWIDGSITLGKSRITPFVHSALETLFVRTDSQWFVVVRERVAEMVPDALPACRDVDADGFGRLHQECLMWPLDYVMIEGARAGCRMKVRAGVFGSVPIYCRAFDDRVIISWDSADLVTASSAIDTEIASHRLALRTVYSARQLCIGITLLTERASLYVEPGRVSYRYPAPIEETIPLSRPNGADALAEFGKRLHRAVSGRPMTADRISVELSGGMDSATVAGAAATLCGSIASMGILLDGDVREPQIRRRRYMVNRLGLLDDAVEMAAFPPDLDLQPKPGQVTGLYQEYYLEACIAMWGTARARGRDLLFTGVGGDELFPIYADEVQEANATRGREDEAQHYAEQLLTPRALSAARSLRLFDAPESPVPATVLLTHACRAPDALRQGLWPVNPLGDPALVAFCHRLPRQSRHGRDLMRQYLHARLGDEVFPRGYRKETFAQVFPALIAENAAPVASQLRDCALGDLGLVDPRAVLTLLDTVVTTRARAPTAALVSFLWLERFVRQVC